MFLRNFIALPALLVITACGGDSSKIDLTGAASSVVLSAGQSVVAENESQLLAVNFTDSATGSIVTIAEFADLTDVSIEIKDKVAGQSTILVTGSSSANTISSLMSSEDTQLILAAQFDIAGIDGVSEEPTTISVHGLDIDVRIIDTIAGTTEVSQGNIQITTGGETVMGTFGAYTVGTDEAFALGYTQVNGDFTLQQPTGPYQYDGFTAVFTEAETYQSTRSVMTVNFADLTGSYSADNFVNENGVAVTIYVQSDIILNNTDGTISGSNGSVAFGSEQNEFIGYMELQGVMSRDFNAVAGAFVADEPTAAGGFVGGAFALAGTAVTP